MQTILHEVSLLENISVSIGIISVLGEKHFCGLLARRFALLLIGEATSQR
jgi:hypothetical protein